MSEPKKLSPEEIQALFATPSNTMADSTSTSEVEDTSPRSYGFFGDEEPPVFEDSNWALAEAKALGLDVGVPMATGIAASPLLALGPKGWLAYAAIQAFSGSASNYGAQKIRNPEADVDFGENVASAGLSMIPGIAPARVAKLGKPALMAVRGVEGAAMGASEAVFRQTIQIIDESNPREELDYFEIGFGSVFGSALGTGLGRIEASSMINRMGVSTSDAKKIQKRMEAEAAKQIARLDVQIKNAKKQGNDVIASNFQKEKDALKVKLEDVSRTDREYIENLRKQAANKKEEITRLADQQAVIRKEAGEAPLPKAPQADVPTAPKKLWEMSKEEFESPYATASSEDTVIMYHRTSQQHAERIKKEGLKKGEDDVVWLTEKPDTNYKTGALIEVEIKKADIANFDARGRKGWKVTDKDISPENIKNIHEVADDAKFDGSYDALRSNPKVSAKARKAVVKAAVERGEQVPENVLKDFPDLGADVPTAPKAPEGFEQTKVVDKEGKPAVMYHGSVEDFDVFDVSKMAQSDPDAPFNGFWFTSDKGEASPAFRNPKVIKEFFLDIKNPAPPEVYRELSKKHQGNELREELQKLGYDGVKWGGYELIPTKDPNKFIVKSPRMLPDEVGSKILKKEPYSATRPDGTKVEGEEWNLYDVIPKAGGNKGEDGLSHITGYTSPEEFMKVSGSEKTWVAFSPEQIKSASSKNLIDETIFGRKADAPTPPKAPTKEPPQQPVSKFTKEQKLAALERMGMSDEDLGALIEGKTDILPLNLGAFTTDTDIQTTMASVLEQVEKGFKKRRVKTDKKSLIKQAAELRSKLDPSIDELAYAKQIANESEEIIFKTVVADSMTFKAFQNWNSKMSSDLDFNDPVVLNDLMADLDRLGEFAEASSTIGSSAGKLLQSRKVSRDQIAATISEMERKANKVEKEMTEELVKYSKDMKPAELKKQLEKLGGLKSLRGFAAELRLVRDPTKLGNLLKITRKSKLRKFADMYMELRYDMILSAPTTQAAAASGNALMGTYSLLNQAVGGVLTGELASSRMALRTAKNLWLAVPDAYRAAKIAAKNSKGQMALSTHYEKVGGKALAMESTGLKGAVGETVENLGELVAFGPKGLVFQDEFYRHMFAKAQAKALIADEYRQLVKAGTAPAGKINEYIKGKLSAYFVNGQRLKTRQDVQLEAVQKAREQGLEADEAATFIKKYTDENWTNKLSSELEYIRDVGDRVTFQQEISGEKGNFFEDVASKVSDLRNKEGVGGFVTQYTLPFIKTPVNIFKEVGGTASVMADIPVVGKMWKRSRAEFESSNPHIRVQARGRQIVGAGLWSTALYLAYNQVTTGSGPQNWKELQNKKNTGWLPNALNWSAMKRLHATGDSGGDQIGDSYVSLQRLDPLATITGLASDLFRAHEDNEMGEGANRVANTIMLALSEQVAQKSYLQTVGNALDAMSNGKGTDDGVNRFLKEIVRGNTPAILGNVSRSQDPYAREVDSPLDVIRQRVLLDSRSLDPRRDIFGEEVAYNARATIREYNAVSPAMYSEVKMDKATWITQELDIVSNFPDSDKVIPGLDLKEINVTGSKHSLYDRLKQLYSETDVKKDVIEVYEDPDLARITKPKRGQPFKDYRKSAVMSVMKAYRTEALALLLDEYPELEAQYEHMGELTEQQLEGEELPANEGLVAPELRQLLNQ